MKPAFIPPNDNSWKQLPLAKGMTAYYEYFDEDKNKKFIVIRKDLANGRKVFFPLCYTSEGQYVKKNIWEDERPIYRLPDLLETEKDILITEGEKDSISGQNIFPDLFVTTWSGGCGSKYKTDWSPLEGRNVTLWPDTDKHGRKAMNELAFFLKEEFNINVKIVDVPEIEFHKNAWGLDDDVPPDWNLGKLLEEASEPKIETIPFSDINEALNNLVFIRNLGNRYFDLIDRKVCTELEINNLYLRSKGKGSFSSGKATEWLQRNNIKIVHGTTFFPSDQETIWRDNREYINIYEKPIYKKLNDFKIESIEWVFKLMRYLVSYDEEEFERLKKLVACAVQYPHLNRQWSLLISSDQGKGKGLFYEIVMRLVGKKNCKALQLPHLYNNFNSHLLQANNLFVKEVNSKGKEDSQTIATLKELHTEEEHEIEFKGKEKLTHYCHYNLYLSTNEAVPLKVTRDDRRYHFVRNDLPPLEEEFYLDIKYKKLKSERSIDEVAHYFAHEVKITEEEAIKFYSRAPWSKWKDMIVKESKTNYEQEVEQLLIQQLIPSFHWKLFNRDQVYQEMRDFYYNDNRNSGFALTELKGKKQLTNALRSIGCVPFKTYAIEPKTPTIGVHKKLGHYWVHPQHVEEVMKWGMAEVNKHFDDHFTYRKAHKQKEKSYYKNDTLNQNAKLEHVGDRIIFDKQEKNSPY